MRSAQINGNLKNRFNPMTMDALELAYHFWSRCGCSETTKLSETEINMINLKLSRVGKKFTSKNRYTAIFHCEGQPILEVHRRADKTGVITMKTTVEEAEQEQVRKTCRTVADRYIPQLEAALRSGDIQRAQFLQVMISTEMPVPA